MSTLPWSTTLCSSTALTSTTKRTCKVFQKPGTDPAPPRARQSAGQHVEISGGGARSNM